MFDVVETSNFPSEPPLELTAPEQLVDELASALRSRDREEARSPGWSGGLMRPRHSVGTAIRP